MPVLCRVSVRDWRLPPCAVQGNVAEKAGERVCRNGSVGAGDPNRKKEKRRKTSGSTPSNYEPGQYSLKQQLFSRENFRTKMLACFRGNDPDKGEGPESDQPWNAIAVSKLCGMVNWQQALNELWFISCTAHPRTTVLQRILHTTCHLQCPDAALFQRIAVARLHAAIFWSLTQSKSECSNALRGKAFEETKAVTTLCSGRARTLAWLRKRNVYTRSKGDIMHTCRGLIEPKIRFKPGEFEQCGLENLTLLSKIYNHEQVFFSFSSDLQISHLKLIFKRICTTFFFFFFFFFSSLSG